MDLNIKMLVLQILTGFIPIYQAAETLDVTYCELYTHIYVNVSDPDGNTIVTRTESDGDTYSNNLYCAWGLYAASGKRTHVKVEHYDLAEVPEGADCYDHTYVAIKQDDIQDSYNWLEADPGMYFRVCGSLVPPEFTSADNNVIIEFSSETDNNQYRGVEFTATEFADGTCPPGWTDINEICYKLFTNKETWNVAQEFCTLVQSNLASVGSEAEAEAIHDMIASSENISAGDWVWLGLVYPVQTDNTEWIDKLDMTFNLTNKWPEVDPDMSENEDINRCSAVSDNGMRTFQSCHDSNNKYAYICKSQKDGSTMLYAVSYKESVESSTANVNSACYLCASSYRVLMLSLIYLIRSIC